MPSRAGLVFLAVTFAIVWSLELLADFRPFPGIWWTHRQAMDYGGMVFAGVFLLVFLRGKS